MIVRMDYNFFMLLFSWLWVQHPVESLRNFAGSWHLKKVVAPQILQRVVWSPLQKRNLFRSFASPTSIEASVVEVKDKRPYSFVQDEMRPYAMKLHTTDQAPKEGRQKPKTPFTKWQPTRQDYLQFLIDSLMVYSTFDKIILDHAALHSLRQTGLERTEALQDDIEWLLKFDPTLQRTEASSRGVAYVRFLHKIAATSIPRFICHFYNFYFAHTAGGRLIGAKMADLLLEKRQLKFYQWDGDVKVMLDRTRRKIDEIALAWSLDDKRACLDETPSTFHYGEAILSVISFPPM